MRKQFGAMTLQFREIVERIGSIQFTRVDQTHEQIARMRSIQGLVEGVDYDDISPAFSPDKSHLAFIRSSNWGASASDLYLLELSADLKPKGKPQRLTFYNRQVVGIFSCAAGQSSHWMISGAPLTSRSKGV
jgi:hypothetical protein